MITVKQADEKNAGEIAALADIVWHEHFVPIIGLDQVEYMLDKFQSEKAIGESMRGGGYEYYMAFENGDFIGYMGIHEDKEYNSVLLSKIYIKKEHRGKGAARALLNHVMASYSKCGMFWLTVNKHNSSAIAAYEKLGFKTERESVTDIGGGFVMDDYVMVIRR